MLGGTAQLNDSDIHHPRAVKGGRLVVAMVGSNTYALKGGSRAVAGAAGIHGHNPVDRQVKCRLCLETTVGWKPASRSGSERRDSFGPNSGPNSGNTGAGNWPLSSEKGHAGDYRVAESLGSSPISHPNEINGLPL